LDRYISCHTETGLNVTEALLHDTISHDKALHHSGSLPPERHAALHEFQEADLVIDGVPRHGVPGSGGEDSFLSYAHPSHDAGDTSTSIWSTKEMEHGEAALSQLSPSFKTLGSRPLVSNEYNSGYTTVGTGHPDLSTLKGSIPCNTTGDELSEYFGGCFAAGGVNGATDLVPNSGMGFWNAPNGGRPFVGMSSPPMVSGLPQTFSCQPNFNVPFQSFPLPPPRVPCPWPLCCESFVRATDVERHIQSVHMGIRYHCFWTGCGNNRGNGYCRVEKLRTHQRQNHGYALM
jgi:hypothetical protein